MPSTPHAARPSLTPLIRAASACACIAALLSGCASTDRLASTTPPGIDLSGQWQLNLNLSDDPLHVDDPKDKDLPPKAPAPSRNPGGFGRPGGGMGMPGGPGSIDPGGGPDDLTSAATPATGLVPVRYAQDTGLPASSSDGPSKAAGAPPPREGTVNRMLEAPPLLTITQQGNKITVKAAGSSEEYTAGEQRTIPFGQTQAERSSGWRESAFVVITKAKKGPSKEDDYALDSEGHLIFATLVTHVKKGPIDFKRVYDRVKTPN